MTTLDTEGSRRTSVSVHFRIWTDMYDSLEEEARMKNVSLNMLLNQVISTHTRDDFPSEEMRFLRMSRDVFRVCLSLIPDDKLSEFGRRSAESEDTVLLAKDGAVTINAVLNELRLLSRFSWFSFHETEKGGKETISLVHDLGPRYSVGLGAYVTSLFALVGVSPKVTTTDSSVLITY